MKKRRLILSVALAVVLVLSIGLPVLAATSQDVSVTATPTYIALTNSEASWAIGAVDVSSTYWWTTDGNAPAPEPFEADDMKSTIQNTGNVAEDIDIKCANFTGGAGWTLSADDTPAEGEISLRAGITGTTNETSMIQVVNGDNELKGNLASTATIKWCMELETAATFVDGDVKTGIVTLTATET